MPDATAGVFTGLYWVATGKTPMDALNDDEQDELEGGQADQEGDESAPGLSQGGAWSGGRGFGQ